jgi:ankyrin repeat protein
MHKVNVLTDSRDISLLDEHPSLYLTNKEIITIRFSHPEYIESSTKDGTTPIIALMRYPIIDRIGFYNMHSRLALLISLDANVSHQDVYGTTPLMLACQKCAPRAVSMLLDAGANTALGDVDGKTARDYIRIPECDESNRLLELLSRVRQHSVVDSLE